MELIWLSASVYPKAECRIFVFFRGKSILAYPLNMFRKSTEKTKLITKRRPWLLINNGTLPGSRNPPPSPVTSSPQRPLRRRCVFLFCFLSSLSVCPPDIYILQRETLGRGPRTAEELHHKRGKENTTKHNTTKETWVSKAVESELFVFRSQASKCFFMLLCVFWGFFFSSFRGCLSYE